MRESSACIPGILETIPNLATLRIPGNSYAIGFPCFPSFVRMALLIQFLTQESFHNEL